MKCIFGASAPCIPAINCATTKAGEWAGHSGSREYRRDPECLRQEPAGRASGCFDPSCRRRSQCRYKSRTAAQDDKEVKMD